MTTSLTTLNHWKFPRFLERLAPWKVFTFLFLWQFLPALQGLALHDEGFYAVFYQQIFNDPESVQFNFMYWFSGVVGAGWFKLFPNGGLLGLRIAGILCTLGTLAIVYKMLKPHFHRGYLYLGIILSVMALNNEPKELHYNNLSALFYVLAAYFICNGLRLRGNWQFVAAGVVLAFNMFTRIPNMLGIGMLAIVVVHGIISHTSWKIQLKQCILLAGSFGAGIAGIVMTMKAMGHWEIFMNASELLSRMGKSEKGLYNIWTLIGIFFKNYFVSVRTLAIALFLFVVATDNGKWLLPAGIRINISRFMPVLRVALVAALAALVILRFFDNFTLIYLQTGFSVVTAFVLLYVRKDPPVITLTLMGLFIMMVYPLGSNDGILTAGMFSFWLIFPLCVAFCSNPKSASVSVEVAGNDNKIHPFSFQLGHARLAAIKQLMAGFFILMCVINFYFYPHFDKKNRLELTHTVNHKYLRGIHTSSGRATAIEQTLTELTRHVSKGQYMLAYDCIPMFNYLTETRVYVRNAWPWLYEADVFKEELERAEKEKKSLPVVLVQKMITMGEGGYWPSKDVVYDTDTWPVNEERNAALNEFLERNNYNEVWENDYFKIYTTERELDR